MAKVTSKYQVTVPRVIAEQYHIHPGDEIEWLAAGDAIRVIPPGKVERESDRDARLRLFDEATERHRRRPFVHGEQSASNRGWTREDLYKRGRSR